MTTEDEPRPFAAMSPLTEPLTPQPWPPPINDFGATNQSQRLAVEEVAKCYSSLGKPPEEVVREGSLREILACSPLYASERTTVLPCAPDLVSWPERGSRPVQVADLLAPADQEWFAELPRHLLRPPEEACSCGNCRK